MRRANSAEVVFARPVSAYPDDLPDLLPLRIHRLFRELTTVCLLFQYPVIACSERLLDIVGSVIR